MTPIETIFEEGKVMFMQKYGSKPDSAYVSAQLLKAVKRFFGLYKCDNIRGLPVYELGKDTAIPELHMTKVVNGRRWIQVQKIKPKMMYHGEVAKIETDQEDLEDAEWLTSESPLQ